MLNHRWMFNKIQKIRKKYNVYRERGNCLINKSVFLFKNMSYDCLEIFCRPYLFTKKDFESEGEKR